MYPIIAAEYIAPDVKMFQVQVPPIAKKHQAGQFVILRVHEKGERIPLTIADSDPEKGTITLIVQGIGRTTKDLNRLESGDAIQDIVGPLGMPTHIENWGLAVVVSGGVGTAEALPIARAMKEAGNKVICVAEASTRHLFYMEDELRGVCDELLFVTKDGSRGRKGGVQEVFVELLEGPTPPDLMVAVGCTFMMRMVSEATESHGVPLQVALKSIMVDGTGMCGACRVSIGGETKFACVDGPFFDGHAVDWDELMSRLGAFHQQEVDALRQSASRSGEDSGEGHECRLGQDRR